MSCGHCVTSVTKEVKQVHGVSDGAIDLESKSIVVSGHGLDDVAVRAAIAEAGYEANA